MALHPDLFCSADPSGCEGCAIGWIKTSSGHSIDLDTSRIVHNPHRVLLSLGKHAAIRPILFWALRLVSICTKDTPTQNDRMGTASQLFCSARNLWL